MSLREKVLAFAESEYGVLPDYPWVRTPEHAVLRHPLNRKWFALVMCVPRRVLGLPGEGMIDVMNVKCEELLQGSFLHCPGVLRAYHMNKEKWLAVLLDGTATEETAFALIRMSHSLTRPVLKGRKT